MNRDDFETAAVTHELLAELGRLDEKFFEGDAALGDPQSVVEGYRWIFTILRVAMDAHVWADPANPRFVDIVGPYEKWGGDNADAFYQYAPIDPTRTYRVRCTLGDAVYSSLTVYGGPDDGRYSERIVGSVNDRDATRSDDGVIEIVLSPEEHEGNWVRLEADAVAAITRDYLAEPTTARRATWEISAVDPPESEVLTDAEMAHRLRAALTWVRDQASIVPIAPGEANTVDEPYPVPTETFGWAAGDAAYAMGRFELGPDEALVVRGRSPACAFWNLCLWNPFLHTYNYDYGRVTINGHQVAYEDDGTWEIVISARDPRHPNWVSTQDHPTGLLWFRWFLPDQTPVRPSASVAQVSTVTSKRST